jgi:hypothetical protein
MEPRELSEARATVIERAINVEGLLDVIISQHYLGRVTKSFLFDVLYDEYFSFGLKVKIFGKKSTERSAVHKLNRLGSIRNYFAHRGRLTVDFERGEYPFVPDPKKPSEPINFESLLREFHKLADELEPLLMEQYRRAGGELLDDAVSGGKNMIHAESDSPRGK